MVPDGTIALGELGFSDDGKYLAYSRSEAGSDWSVWHVLEIATAKQLPDELRWTKFSQRLLDQGRQGLFLRPLRAAQGRGRFQSLNFNHKLYYHRIGTPQEADVLVYYRPEHPDWQYDGEVSEDGRYLVISIVVGTDAAADRHSRPDRALCHALRADRQFRARIHLPGERRPAALLQDRHRAAPPTRDRHRLRAAKKKEWQEIIPQAANTLTEVSLVGDRFIALYLQDASTEVKLFSIGRKVRPGRATARHRHRGRIHGQAATASGPIRRLFIASQA